LNEEQNEFNDSNHKSQNMKKLKFTHAEKISKNLIAKHSQQNQMLTILKLSSLNEQGSFHILTLKVE